MKISLKYTTEFNSSKTYINSFQTNKLVPLPGAP